MIKLKETHMKFMVFCIFFLMGATAMLSLWTIDIAVGAMNSGGCVFQDTRCIPALQYYEQGLSVAVFAVSFLFLSALVIIAF